MTNLKNYTNKKFSVHNKTVFVLKFDHFVLSPEDMRPLEIFVRKFKKEGIDLLKKPYLSDYVSLSIFSW